LSSFPAAATVTRPRTTLPRKKQFNGEEADTLWLYLNSMGDIRPDDTDNDDYDDYDSDDNDEGTTTTTMTATNTIVAKEKKGGPSTLSRWASMNPKIKQRVVKVAQERAIENKKKREPTQDKKRREFLFF
jgi:hypothetical protein